MVVGAVVGSGGDNSAKGWSWPAVRTAAWFELWTASMIRTCVVAFVVL